MAATYLPPTPLSDPLAAILAGGTELGTANEAPNPELPRVCPLTSAQQMAAACRVQDQFPELTIGQALAIVAITLAAIGALDTEAGPS